MGKELHPNLTTRTWSNAAQTETTDTPSSKCSTIIRNTTQFIVIDVILLRGLRFIVYNMIVMPLLTKT